MSRVLAAGILAGVLAVVTSGRVADWHDNEAIWRASVVLTPAQPRPRVNLAAALVNLGALDEAEAQIQMGQVAAVERADWAFLVRARETLVQVRLGQGRREEAAWIYLDAQQQAAGLKLAPWAR